jgi:hypothetical protein
MKTKLWLCFLVLIVRPGFAEDASSPQDLEHPQVIKMDDGTKLTLLGVTTGRRQMAPQYESLPTANWVYSRSNLTMVWIKAEHDMQNWQTYQLLVSDPENTGCVNIEKRTSSHVKTGVDILGYALKAFPRWDNETIIRVKPYMGVPSTEHFVLTNPPPGAVADWIPKPLPDTESDGDLEVTLTKLVAGAPTPSWRGGSLTPTNDPANRCVHLNFDFKQNGQSTTNWYPWPVQTTDASGNWSRGLIYPYPTNGVRRIWGRMKDGANIPRPEHYEMDGYYFQPGLWPDRPWKVRLEFIQRSGFSADELVTFTNVPVRFGSQQDFDDEWTWNPTKTNFTFVAEGEVNGVRMKMLPPLLYPASVDNGQKHIGVIIETDPSPRHQAMNLTILQVTDGQGREVWHPFSPDGAGHFSIDFPNPGNVKTLNLKLALHRSRFVEFVVRPTKP